MCLILILILIQALVSELLDIARREGDKQEQAAQEALGFVADANMQIFRPLLPAIEAEQQSLPGAYQFFPWVGGWVGGWVGIESKGSKLKALRHTLSTPGINQSRYTTGRRAAIRPGVWHG